MSKPYVGPAFPHMMAVGHRDYAGGMSLRQYAAIHLRVPDSGEVWLDEMIERSRRDEFAKAVVLATAGTPEIRTAVNTASASRGITESAGHATCAYEIADAMLERSKP